MIEAPPDLTGTWTEKSGRQWQITMSGTSYTMQGLGTMSSRSASGTFVKQPSGKWVATTTWTPSGSTLQVTIEDPSKLTLSNGDEFIKATTTTTVTTTTSTITTTA